MKDSLGRNCPIIRCHLAEMSYIPLNGSSDFGTVTDIRWSKFLFENNSNNVT
jgi:hypothetical protein